jgi:hypothetical protein
VKVRARRADSVSRRTRELQLGFRLGRSEPDSLTRRRELIP